MVTRYFMRIIWGLALCLTLASPSIYAQSAPVDLTEISLEDLLSVRLLSPKGDAKAPILLNWAVGYQYVHASFEDYKEGSHSISSEDVLARFPAVPTKIKQQAHMLMLRRHLGDNRYFTAQIPYLQQETDHIRRKGDPFTIRTEGLGDVAVGYSFIPWSRGAHSLWLNGGLRLPTGSIVKTGDTPRGKNTLVPYTMQLGSGTFDVAPGVIYLHSGDSFHVGASANALIRLGRNSRYYSLSDRFNLALWASQEVSDWLTASIKLEGKKITKIDGADPALDRTIVPVADPTLYGGERLDLLAALTATMSRGSQKYTFRVEVGVPVYQDLNGPQPGFEGECTLYLGRTF